jgi:hypothetical protein
MIQVADTAWTTESCDSGFVGSKLFYPVGALAPDKRLYYFTNNGCNELTFLEHPDSTGLSSSMNYVGISLPVIHATGVPYFPNYRLGPVTGSICDSLTSVHELQPQEISLYPNPATDQIQITSSRSLNETVITLYNIHSQILLQQSPGFGNNFELSIPPDIGTGIYMLRIQSKEGVVTKKIVVGR